MINSDGHFQSWWLYSNVQSAYFCYLKIQNFLAQDAAEFVEDDGNLL